MGTYERESNFHVPVSPPKQKAKIADLQAYNVSKSSAWKMTDDCIKITVISSNCDYVII